MDETQTAPSPYDTDWFTDTDALDKMLRDKRATDMMCKSSSTDAAEVVNAFVQETNAGTWSPSLRRPEVAQRLAALAASPRLLDQAALNLCGPAALFQIALGRDPVAVMQFATQLYDNGSASIGNLTVAPRPDLLSADYDAMVAQVPNNRFYAADWMLLGALRNATQVFWQPSWTGDPDQELAALTRPEELADWMRQSGIWSSIEDHGKWASNPGLPNATALTLNDGTDIALLINANLIAKSVLLDPEDPSKPASLDPGNPNPHKPDNSFLLSAFPNHWVVLLNEVVIDPKQENALMAIWSWGQKLYMKTPLQDFADNYYGAVIANL
jgi:hypothetical protein